MSLKDLRPLLYKFSPFCFSPLLDKIYTVIPPIILRGRSKNTINPAILKTVATGIAALEPEIHANVLIIDQIIKKMAYVKKHYSIQ